MARLEPYLQALGHGPQPSTTLKWMGHSAAYDTVLELASGARAVSHAGLDEVDRGMTTTFLRAALVSHGVLSPRGEQAAWFERATARVLADMPAGADRAHVHAFAVWQVGHDLARRERRGQTTRRSAANSLRSVRAAARLATWAAAQDLALGDLGQHDLDRWTEQVSSVNAAHIHTFVRWAARGGLIAPLVSVPRVRTGAALAMADQDRVALVRRLLHDDALDLRDRVAGCLLLIYAQPLTRILAMTVEQVRIDGDRVSVLIGDGPLVLPDPLARLTATLAQTRRERASTAATPRLARWLFCGMRVGQPLDYGHVRRRLRRLGVAPLAGRTGAIITLAATLPPSILAELLGVSDSTAAKWSRLAGDEYGGYAAHRAVAH